MHLRVQEQCGQKRIQQWGTSDPDKADGMDLHREIAAVAAAVAAVVDIAGSRGCSSRSVNESGCRREARQSGADRLLPVIFPTVPEWQLWFCTVYISISQPPPQDRSVTGPIHTYTVRQSR